MLSLAQAMAHRGSIGEPLPPVFPGLDDAGVHFRRSNLVMVAAGPGVGKSSTLLYYAVKVGVPALYISADTDPFTMGCKAAAILSGHSTDTVEDGWDKGAADFYSDLLDELWTLQFCFASSPSMDDILDEVECYGMVNGEYPSLIVIDNLRNLSSHHDDDGKAFREIVSECHLLARDTMSCVVLLHHATGEYDDGDKAIPASGVEYKLTKIPEVVLTLSRVEDELRVAPVKNRTGRADAKAKWVIRYRFDLGRMSIDPITPTTWAMSPEQRYEKELS